MNDFFQGNGPSRHFEGYPTLQRDVATLLCILCLVLHVHNGVCWGIHCVPPWKVGRSNVSLLVRDDRDCATIVLVLESRPSLTSTSSRTLLNQKTDNFLQWRAFRHVDFMANERRIVDEYETASEPRDITLNQDEKCI